MINSYRANKNKSNAETSRLEIKILCAFFFFDFVRIQDNVASFLAPLSIPMFLVIALIVIILKHGTFKYIFSNRIFFLFLLLLMEILIWVPFATNNYVAYHVAKSMILTFLICVSVVEILNNEKKYIYFNDFWIVITTIVSMWVILHDGKGPGGFLSDENDVCLILVCALPFSWFRLRSASSKKFRFFLYFSVLITILAIIITRSRGGFLGLVAVLLMFIWFSDRRYLNFAKLIIATVLFGSLFLSLIPNDYISEVRSISDSNDDTRNLRFLHWTTGFEMYKDNVVFGVGPGNYPWNSQDYFFKSPFYEEGARVRAGRQAHSLYFTLIPELGTFGIIIFYMMIYSFFKSFKHKYNNIDFVNSDHSLKSNNTFMVRAYENSLIVSMIGFLVTSSFISVLYYPMIWYLLSFSVSLNNIKRSLYPAST